MHGLSFHDKGQSWYHLRQLITWSEMTRTSSGDENRATSSDGPSAKPAGACELPATFNQMSEGPKLVAGTMTMAALEFNVTNNNYLVKKVLTVLTVPLPTNQTMTQLDFVSVKYTFPGRKNKLRQNNYDD